VAAFVSRMDSEISLPAESINATETLLGSQRRSVRQVVTRTIKTFLKVGAFNITCEEDECGNTIAAALPDHLGSSCPLSASQ